MADTEKKSNRPEDSDFKQQRLSAWQPILTPNWVIGTFLSVGVVFLAIGIAVLVTSNNVVEISSSDYSDISGGVSIPVGAAQGACVQGARSYGGSCIKKVEVEITEDMDSPVYLYFELSNFYQNHRRYVKSRNDNQLMSNSDATTTDQCSPIDVTASDTAIYPCGLIAWSVFNDTIYAMSNDGTADRYYTDYIMVRDAGASTCNNNNCIMKATTSDGIAWSSDKDDKFEKLSSCPGSSGDGMGATGLSPAIAMPYDTYKYYMCGDGSGTCQPSSQVYNAQGKTQPNEASNLCFDMTAPTDLKYGATGAQTKSTCTLANRCGDVSNEEFIVWMRTSGLPTFRKLHRKINHDLKKGQTIVFHVNDVFPVSAFSGSKKLVLSTTAWIGGKNTFLGAAYITVACICILLGIGFFIKEMTSARGKAQQEE